ncbi:uncharacterized protein LOC143910645 [Arctopsyche grandis]|uniref:uncharacterized protein LOC143910645 n=1 Tax=Arctopsyche grandis TaxID=121162 RepID=UPI00406D84CE
MKTIQLLLALFAIPVLCSCVEELNSTYEDFSSDLGIFNTSCIPGRQLLDRKSYDDNIIPKPIEANGYFMSANTTSCSQTVLYETTREFEIMINSFRFRETTATFDVLILNENNTVVQNITLDFNRLYDWRYDNLTFSYPLPFRIRLSYVTLYDEVVFAIDHIVVNLLDEIYTTEGVSESTTEGVSESTTEPPEIPDCVKDDFGFNSPGLLKDYCGNAALSNFTVMQYSNWNNISKPLGSNDYFMMSENKFSPSCAISSSPLSVEANTTLVLSIYTDNEVNSVNSGFLFIVNANNSDIIIQFSPITIDSSRYWRNVEITIQFDADILLKFQMEALSNPRAFLAIDHLGFRSQNGTDCISTCQCSRNLCSNAYVSIEGEQGGASGLGTTSIIISTTVVVSVLWGAVLTAFIFTKNRRSKQDLLDNEVRPGNSEE